MSSARTWARRSALLLASLLVTSLLAEGAYRVAKRLRYRSLAAQWDHELFVMQPGRDHVYVLRPDTPGSSKIEETGARWSYRVNSAGLRGPELLAADERGVRILALGDSYTFGWAVEDEEAYPRVLEGLLNGEPDAPRVEVVNAGHPGYNTTQQAALLELLLDELEPDLVTLGFVMNDAEPPRSVPCPPDVLYGFSSSWLFEQLKAAVNARFDPEHPPFESRLFRQRDYRELFAPGRPERAACRSALAAVAALCEARNVPLHMFVLPDLSRPTDESYPYSEIHDTLLAWASELEISAVDLLPPFAGRSEASHAVPGDGHPDAAAQRIFALEMARTLEPALDQLRSKATAR